MNARRRSNCASRLLNSNAEQPENYVEQRKLMYLLGESFILCSRVHQLRRKESK